MITATGSRIVSLTVIGIPQPKGSTRGFVAKSRQRVITTSANPRVKDWQRRITTAAATAHHGALFTGPVIVRAWFYLPRPKSLATRITTHVRKPDCDKLIRAVGDALCGVLYRDDAQVVEWHAWKLYAAPGRPPAAEIHVLDGIEQSEIGESRDAH